MMSEFADGMNPKDMAIKFQVKLSGAIGGQISWPWFHVAPWEVYYFFTNE